MAILNRSHLPVFFTPARYRLATAVVLSWLITGVSIAEESARELTYGPLSSLARRVRVVFEVDGKLRLNPDGKEVRDVPLKAYVDSLFVERVFPGPESPHRRVRSYQSAQGTFQIAGSEIRSQLPTSRNLVVTEQLGESWRLLSPQGPLTQQERELLDTPGSTLVINQLLPTDKVRVGESWHHPDQTVQHLFQLESLESQTLTSTFREVQGNLAILEIKGEAKGSVGGASTEIKFEGKYNYDFALKEVTWFTGSIVEDRGIGHADPGVQAKSRIRVATVPTDVPASLTDAALAVAKLPSPQEPAWIQFSSTSGGFAFRHRDAWRTLTDRHDVSILRMVSRGDLVAQCNVSGLPSLEPEKEVSREAFVADVQRALGAAAAQLVAANEFRNPQGLRVLRADFTGVVSELTILWTYYHISNDSGRQASLVFTREEKVAEQFGRADQEMLDSFRFEALPAPTPVSISNPTKQPDR